MAFETDGSTKVVKHESNPNVVWEYILKLERELKPKDGWIAAVLLVFNLVVVVWSVEQANWVATPNLVLLLLLATLTSLALYRVPVWSLILLPVGLGIGLSIVLWQLSNIKLDGIAVGGTNEVVERLILWWEAALMDSISIDSLPFGFALMSATWITGFLGAWLFLRYGNFWGVFVLGGIGLLSNLTFLPPNSAFHLGFYLFTALILVARVQAIRRKQGWEQRSVKVDDHLAGLYLSDSFGLTILIIITAFLIPVAPKLTAANNAYEFMRQPLESIEDDFNRLFAGLPARRPLGFRIWDNVMALQGSIYPTTTQVLQVESQTEMYWKARTYSTYNGKGWYSEHTSTNPLGYKPEFTQNLNDLQREKITYKITPFYDSSLMFTSHQLLNVDRDVMIETQSLPVFTIGPSVLEEGEPLPEYLQEAGLSLTKVIYENGPYVNDFQLGQSLPDQFRIEDVDREGGRLIEIRLIEALPATPEVLSVTSKHGKFESGDTYQVTSAISLAEPTQLRNATTNYPAWVSERYLQLPVDLPNRVRDLASTITSGLDNPYEKARAIENYLRTNYRYNLKITPPPFNADGIDHFLFTLGEGYSEYFASTMAVMLRTLDVPARLAVGYTTGDRVEEKPLFAVRDSHSHAWLEVYFPKYGWIPFEPTPGQSLPEISQFEEQVLTTRSTGQGNFDPLEEECYNDTGDFLSCEEGEDASATSELKSNLGRDILSIWIFPWAFAVLVTLVVISGTCYLLLWRRFMTVPNDPIIAFRKMTALARLASAGPDVSQTPYQFGVQLRDVFPSQGASVSAIVAAYVRNRYGNKYPTASEKRLLAVAWRRLRLPMVKTIIKRRVR
jgi:transglutaminase-like putative cysteine protease